MLQNSPIHINQLVEVHIQTRINSFSVGIVIPENATMEARTCLSLAVTKISLWGAYSSLSYSVQK